MMKKEDKRITRILIAMTLMFVALIAYLTYIQIFLAPRIIKNSYNKRQWLDENLVIRGKIYDRDLKLLASSETTKDEEQRIYLEGRKYGHIIGYSTKQYGKSGIEASYNRELLNLSRSSSINEIKKLLPTEERRGNNLILTLDEDVQNEAYRLLNGKNKKGAIVVMHPGTGEIYAMVSYPDFDPNNLSEEWERLIANENSPLLNRATQGLYTPGSIFKVITATAVLEDGLKPAYDCKGSVLIDGYRLNDYKGEAHGEVDLKEALVESCNVAFGQMGLAVGQDKLQDTTESFMFNESLPFALPTKASVFPEERMSQPELGASAIGQGELLVTPLHMAMVASAIANDGVMMKPMLIKEIRNSHNQLTRIVEAEAFTRATTENIAREIKGMMVDVVNQGTGRQAKIKGVAVGGKTGTAENDKEKVHSWFIGFAPVENPQVAVAVVLENSGLTGNQGAGPIVKRMIEKTLDMQGQ